jgi:hypothetical protein
MRVFGEISLLATLPIAPHTSVSNCANRVIYEVDHEHKLVDAVLDPNWPVYLSCSNYIGFPSYYHSPNISKFFYCVHNNLRLYSSINKAIFLENNLITETLGSQRTYNQILQRWPSILGLRQIVDQENRMQFVRLVSESEGRSPKRVGRLTDNGRNDTKILIFSTTEDDKNVHHFIYESIPKLLPFLDLPRNAIKLFFSYQPTQFQTDMLTLFGVEFDYIYNTVKEDVLFDEAIIVSYPDPSFGYRPFLDKLRERVLPKLHKSVDKPRKILVHRADSRNRTIHNRDYLIHHYTSLGYTPVTMSQLRAHDQILLFANADEIVLEAGAAGAFLAFCKPGIRVTEISPPPNYFGSFNGISPIHWLLSLTADLDFQHILLDFVDNRLIFRPD